MGNHHATGHFFNFCGCTDAFGFEGSAKAVINMYDIKPWNARSLIRDRLNKQGDFARKSPLRKVPVKEGLKYFRDKVGGSWIRPAAELQREHFVEMIIMLLGHLDIPHNPREREDLYNVFDSMDFDGNGTLSTGEWAAGLSVYFKGSMAEAVRAVFDCLDANGDGAISKSELQVYLSPFVKAMSPPEAAALRPLLEKKAVDDIYYDMDMDHAADISSDEMLSWSQRGNNIVDRLADIIDQEVYQIWLSESKKRATNMRRSSERPGSPSGAYDGSYGSYHSQDGTYMQGPNGNSPSRGPNGPNGPNGESPMSHSEYGPPPSYSNTSPKGQDRSNGWFGYFNGTAGASPASRSPASAPPAPSAPANFHDPFAMPRNAVPPPPPPPAPGRAAPMAAAGFQPSPQATFQQATFPPSQAYHASPYHTPYGVPSPCRSSPQYTGAY